MKTLALTALLALLAPIAAAQQLDALLDEAAKVQPGNHNGWTGIRDQIVAQGESALPALTQAAASANWTAEGWVRAMVAEACRLRIQHPEYATVVDNPPGIDPQHYRMFRKPVPFCQRDFNHLPKAAVPLMLERFRWTLEKQDYSQGEAGMAEREALATALLHAPGHHADTRARFALEAALGDAGLADKWRQEAAVSLGKTGGTGAIKALTAILDKGTEPVAVREAAAWAIGRVADTAAYTALQSRLTGTELTAGEHGRRLARAMINGVGILGSRAAWQARGVMVANMGERVQQDCARLLVDQLKARPAEAELIRDQLSVVALEESLAWVQTLAAEGETDDIKNAAKACIEPLKLTLSRYK